MRKSMIILLLFPFITGCLLSPTSAVVHSSLQDQGEINVYFCPREDCEMALTDFLRSAQTSIHCALYDVGLKSVQEILLKKAAQMEVEVVTDDDYLKKFNYPFVKADKYGLMHNKFCIIDGKKISGGSMNPTDNDAHKNNNNLLLISSKILAANYEAEFQELWNGQFKKGNLVPNPQIRIGNIEVENYFCPEDHCAEHVKEELAKAQQSIDFMTFAFTHDGIAHVILLKHLDKIPIRGIMETKQISPYSAYEVLAHTLGTVVKDSNPHNMHHKVFIIDGETVVTGSFNPTQGGDEKNDENILIIHDAGIAGKFTDEFNALYPGPSTSLLDQRTSLSEQNTVDSEQGLSS